METGQQVELLANCGQLHRESLVERVHRVLELSLLRQNHVLVRCATERSGPVPVSSGPGPADENERRVVVECGPVHLRVVRVSAVQIQVQIHVGDPPHHSLVRRRTECSALFGSSSYCRIYYYFYTVFLGWLLSLAFIFVDRTDSASRCWWILWFFISLIQFCISRFLHLFSWFGRRLELFRTIISFRIFIAGIPFWIVVTLLFGVLLEDFDMNLMASFWYSLHSLSKTRLTYSLYIKYIVMHVVLSATIVNLSTEKRYETTTASRCSLQN